MLHVPCAWKEGRALVETPRRTIVKSILWAVIGLVSMSAVGLFFTGSLAVGGGMAMLNALLGFTMYLIYERVWARISWGRL